MRTNWIPRAAIMLAASVGIATACTDSTAPLTKGSLRITLSGPPGAPAVVTVAGPTGQSWTVVTSETLTGLDTGTYLITTTNVMVGTATYGAWPSTQSVYVAASNTPRPASVAYVRLDAVLDLAVSGLPAGVLANVHVQGGPVGFAGTATGSQSFNVLAGTYTVIAWIVSQGGIIYGGPQSFQVVVPPSLTTAFPVSVIYSAVQTGQVTVTVSTPTHTGVLLGSLAAVWGPNNYYHVIRADTTLTDVPLGAYSVQSFHRCFTGVLHAHSLCGPVPTPGSWYDGNPRAQAGVITAAAPHGVALIVYVPSF